MATFPRTMNMRLRNNDSHNDNKMKTSQRKRIKVFFCGGLNVIKIVTLKSTRQ